MATTSQPPTRSKSVTLLDPTEDNGAYDPPKNQYSGQKTANEEEYSDEELEQTMPMMSAEAKAMEAGHQGAAYALGSHSKNQSFDLGGEPEQPSPTGRMAWAGFALSVVSLTSMCIAFASPYWIQQWPLSFNTFENMGLWEACFHNYMHHRDDLQEIYNGCFWVFSGDKKYSKLRDWLLPPWFMAVQVLATICLIILVAVVIVIALVFLHICPMMNHEYHQIFAMFISGAMLFMCTMTTVITGVLFGVQINDRNWMPRPDWNFLSWGFGFLVIAGLTSLAAGLFLFLAASRAYNKLLKLQDSYFHHAMEMSTANPTSMMGQPTYGSGYEDQPTYGPGGYSDGQRTPTYGPGGYSDEPSYGPGGYADDDPSFEKQSYSEAPFPSYVPPDKSTGRYGPSEKSQPSYAPSDKPTGRYQSQPSYGPSEKSQGSYAPSHRPPTYDASLEPVAGYGSQKRYDQGRSYDSGQGYK